SLSPATLSCCCNRDLDCLTQYLDSAEPHSVVSRGKIMSTNKNLCATSSNAQGLVIFARVRNRYRHRAVFLVGEINSLALTNWTAWDARYGDGRPRLDTSCSCQY